MGALKWWQTAVFYQIYPRSFADGNGDGIGDFGGMIERLDYLEDLGIDAVWLSPFYPSPQFDCGYDVSDYLAVAPEYGTLEDFQRFVQGAHQRGIRVIVDWVPNHTSDQHAWFLDARSGRDSARRDWYVWRNGREGGPPNNWCSAFGGSAWEHDLASQQFYYHYFFKQQPDLNWRNPEVKRAMFDTVRFWLDQGADGFRLDAIGTIFEDPEERDYRETLSQAELYRMLRRACSADEREVAWRRMENLYARQMEQPEVHALMRELRNLLDGYPDCVLVGETEGTEYYGNGHDELHLVFNFPLMEADQLTPEWVRRNQSQRLSQLPPDAWPCNTLGNHDRARIYGKYGDGRNDLASAKLSLALMLTLRGTPFLYYGEEIGMTDLLLENLGQFRDNLGVWYYHMEREVMGSEPEEAVRWAAEFGRDKNRTPMQWAGAPNAGFSPPGVNPWLPVNPNFAQGVNVACQRADPDSLFNFYRRLLRLRRQTPALVTGDYEPLLQESRDCLAFLRTSPGDGQSCLIVLNMSDQPQTICPECGSDAGRLLFSTCEREHRVDVCPMVLTPLEIVILELPRRVPGVAEVKL
jgi:alpha-glucosidase